MNRRRFLELALSAPAVPIAGEWLAHAACAAEPAAKSGATTTAAKTAGAAATTATKSGPITPGPALKTLHDALAIEARQAADPWSICHGMLGMGGDLKLESGATAVDFLVTNFLRRDAKGEPYFEVNRPNGEMGEQHPFLVVKKLIELKLKPELWKPLTDHGLESFKMPASQTEWDDATWLLWAVANQPAYTAATTVGPDSVKLGDVATAALERAELADKAVEASLAANGEEKFERPSAKDPASKDSVWGFTCGGQHFLQTVMAFQAASILPASTKPRVEARIAVLQRRLVGESNFRAAETPKALAAGVEPVVAAHQYALSLLKLNGHGLETLGRARDAGLGNAAALATSARGAADRLESSLAAFEKQRELAPYLVAIRTASASTWRLWLGDGCHALHGLRYWS